MAQAKNKTTATKASVEGFIEKQPEASRADLIALTRLLEKVSGEKGKLWGPSIVGFGTYHYKYDSGREGDFLILGYSPRKANLTLYGIMDGEDDPLVKKLGKCTTGKGCIYVKRLADVDLKVLQQMATKRMKAMEKQRVRS